MPAPKAPSGATSLDEWLRWQENLHPQAIELGLDRVRQVATAMALPVGDIRTVTVAGTNGKGSSSALLTEIYRAAGYRVGTYTSPHLLRYNERVAVEGLPVADGELCQAFAAVEQARHNVPLTYFEFGTLAAFWLFRERHVQIQILEVGMGGRLDAVNLVDADCALITNIGLDHREWLGMDRESIGFEKAGVMRSRRPVVSADPDLPQSVHRHARDIGAILWQLGEDYHYQTVADAWNWRGPETRYKKLPPPRLAGATQFRNAAGVLAAITALQHELPVAESAIRSALPRLYLPGRFEKRGQVILDVAHNAEAAGVLADNLRAAGIRGRVLLVLGMLNDKPVEAYCEKLAPLVDRAWVGALPLPRGLSAEALAMRVQACGIEVEACPDITAAYAQACVSAGPEDIIVVSGSFLTVAAVAGLQDG